MIQKSKQILVDLFCFWLLAACALPEWSNVDVVSSAESTHLVVTSTAMPNTPFSVLPDPIQTEVYPRVTPNSTATNVNIIDNPEQVTDGRLKIVLSGAKSSCYGAGDIIPLIITYENLTDKPLIIVDPDYVSASSYVHSAGFLKPVVTTVENNRVFIPDDYKLITTYNPDSTLFLELAANSAFDINLEYRFPPSTAKLGEEGNLITQPVLPGSYLLKFLYVGRPTDGSWEGAVSSNRIKICII